MKRKRGHVNGTGVWFGIGVALIAVTVLGGSGFIAGFGIFCLLISAGVAAAHSHEKTLRTAGTGATRVETVKQHRVNTVVQEYVKAGWQLVAQSSAKSFGSEARVTMTFRKG